MATTDDRVQSLTPTCHQFAARLWTSDLPELNSAKYPHVSPHRTAGRFHAFCRSGWFCFSPTRPSSHTGETLTSQPDGENEPGSNQGRLLFSSSALHLCMCVCLLSHTHTHANVWAYCNTVDCRQLKQRRVKVRPPGGAHPTARECFQVTLRETRLQDC